VTFRDNPITFECRLWESALIGIVKVGRSYSISTAPGGLANASRPHSKLRTRSPLSDEFCAGNMALVTTSARNIPLLTFMHSHAVAQKSSRMFSRVLDRERRRKWPSGARNALRVSQGVRPRGVMFNYCNKQNYQYEN
jgi:hypothetical protein